VLRYNMMIVAPGPGTAFWFEQTQGGIGVIDADPAYHTNYVYGNVFYNPLGSSSIQMFRYDALGIQGQPRNGTLYFYNNTVVNYSNQSQRYGTALFGLPSHSEVLQWNVHDVIDCRNNIFAALPVTAGAPTTLISLLVSDDSTINFGTNWISPGAQLVQLPYLSTNFYGTLNGTNQFLIGDKQGKNNPGFVDLLSTNFHLLSASRAIDASGPQAAAVAGTSNDIGFEYLYPTSGQSRMVSGPALDLGAFEAVPTNFVAARLGIAAAGTNEVLLSWPVSSTAVLQQNSRLGSTNWTGVTNPIVVVGTRDQVTVPLSPGNQYFRLSYP
jgi:hypothetical protein